MLFSAAAQASSAALLLRLPALVLFGAAEAVGEASGASSPLAVSGVRDGVHGDSEPSRARASARSTLLTCSASSDTEMASHAAETAASTRPRRREEEPSETAVIASKEKTDK